MPLPQDLAETASSPSRPSVGLARRSTAEALERLGQTGRDATSNSSWYEPGRDSLYYTSAERAFNSVKFGLKKLKLTAVEIQTMETTGNLDIVLNRMKRLMDQHDEKNEDSKAMALLSRLTNSFSDFSVRVSAIVNILLPQSPEFTVTFGLLMIIFEGVVAKKEKQQAFAEFLESITAQLPIIEFYDSVFPTNAMKRVVSDIYAELISFLDVAVRYYCTGRIAKFLDAVFKPIEFQIEEFLGKITERTKRLYDLKDAAHIAQSIDMKDKLDSTGIVLARLYENFEGVVASIGSDVALLHQQVSRIQSHQDYITTFQAKSYVQSIRQSVYPTMVDSDDVVKQIASHDFRLSQKDQWEFNGVLSVFEEWSAENRQRPLWIGGTSGNQDCWVTEMSIDLIRALDAQDKPVAFVFCDPTPQRSLSHLRKNPTILIELLMVQILEIYPLLAFHNPERMNARRLKKATSFDQTWRMFEMLLEDIKELFIVIDRVDQCQRDEETTVGGVLLPRLIDLVRSKHQISMVITSSHEPPPTINANGRIKSIWIDTSIPARKKYGRRA